MSVLTMPCIVPTAIYPAKLEPQLADISNGRNKDQVIPNGNKDLKQFEYVLQVAELGP